jgi:hypothetical protein
MLANGLDTLNQIGSLRDDVQKPATFRRELLGFIATELPRWRDRSDRQAVTAETQLTSQLCAHLNGVARLSDGWDVLQFRVEESDEQNPGRKVDLVASPSGVTICVEGRRHTEFDVLLPIECKRLPTPQGQNRDEREYVISQYSSTGGIQRFKAGHHGALHRLGAMIGYVQGETNAIWNERIAGWVNNLIQTAQPNWSSKDLLRLERTDTIARLAVLHSSHDRQAGMSDIELCHLWVEMQ